MTATPVFSQTPKLAVGQVSAANTNRDGTGTLVTLLTAGANGARVERITIEAAVTTTAGMVRFFVSVDGGTTKRLWREVPVTAITPSATVAAFTSSINTALYTLPLLLLPASAILYASTHNAEAMNVFAEYGDF